MIVRDCYISAYFDWVYLDSAHNYYHTKNELDIVSKKIKPLGIIIGHDGQPSSEHINHRVYEAVKKFCLKTSWKIVYIDPHTQWFLKNTLFTN